MRVSRTFWSRLAPRAARLWEELFLQVVGYMNDQLRAAYSLKQRATHARRALARLAQPQRRPSLICAWVVSDLERKRTRSLKVGQYRVYSQPQPVR